MLSVQRGFTLLETLIAMTLRQLRQLWRTAREQSEQGAPPPLASWNVRQQQTSSLGCVSIDVTVTSSEGRTAQLLRLDCPGSEQRQE